MVAGNTSKHVTHERRLYYLLERDKDIKLRLFVSAELSIEVLEQCSRKMGHIRINMTHDLIGRHDYWLRLYKDINRKVG